MVLGNLLCDLDPEFKVKNVFLVNASPKLLDNNNFKLSICVVYMMYRVLGSVSYGFNPIC